MRKRLKKFAALFAVAMYVAALLSPESAVGALANIKKTQTVYVAERVDMLPLGRSAPKLVRVSDASELPALLGTFRFLLLFAAALACSLAIWTNDAHFKARSLKIQTARWCAS